LLPTSAPIIVHRDCVHPTSDGVLVTKLIESLPSFKLGLPELASSGRSTDGPRKRV